MLFLILLTGILLRWAVYEKTTRFPRDEAIYLNAAEMICNGQNCENVYLRPLLPPYIAASMAKLFPVKVSTAFRLMNLAASCLLILAGYRIGRQCFGNTVPGLLAALFFAVHPYLLEMSMTALREPLYWLFFALAVYFGLKLLKNQKTIMDTALLGGVTALSILCRIEGAELLSIPTLVFVSSLVFKGRWSELSWKFWLLRALCWGGSLTMVLLLFAVSAFRYTGYFWYPLFWRI